MVNTQPWKELFLCESEDPTQDATSLHEEQVSDI